jgi:hypothetical protein
MGGRLAHASVVKINLPYLSPEKNRHGKDVLFVRRNGRRIRIREKLGSGSPDFMKAYAEALERLSPSGPPKVGQVKQPFPAGTLGWLGTKYFASDEFKSLDTKSQRTRRQSLRPALTSHTKRMIRSRWVCAPSPA